MTIEPNNKPTIGIVMATYNGERYLREQIGSLQSQTYPHWHLYVRDDGSKDNTVSLVKSLGQQDPRITLIQDDLGNLGFNLNFYQALQASKEDYIAFCDQDDVWAPTKLEKLLIAMQQLETKAKIPALVHSEAEIVDSNLNLIKSKFIGKRGTVTGIKGIIFANAVQGASMMINRSLADLVIPVKPKVPFDFHIAIISELKGKRAFLEEPLSKYRQHGNNAIGAINMKSGNDKTLQKETYTLSFLAGLGMYQHIKQDFNIFTPSKETACALQDYFYLFEGKSRFKKIWIYLKNRYPLSRKKDALLLLKALVMNQDLRAIYKENVIEKKKD